MARNIQRHPNDRRVPPIVNFPPEIEFTELEKSAILFHTALTHKLLLSLPVSTLHHVYLDVGTIILFLDGRIRTVFHQDDPQFREFLDELHPLQEVLSGLSKSVTVPKIKAAMKFLHSQYEEIDSLTQGVHIGLPQCFFNYGLEELFHNPEMPSEFRHYLFTVYFQQRNQAPQTTDETLDMEISENKPQPITTDNKTTKKAKTAHHIAASSNNDSEGFQFPRKYAKTNISDHKTLPLSNTFEMLDKLDTSAPENNSISENNPTSENNSASGKPKESGEKPTEQAERPQPIFIKSSNYKDVLEQLVELSEEKFQKKAIDDLIRISPASIEHFRVIQAFLASNNIQFYAMLPKAERPKKVVIRGLPTDTDIEDIKSELQGLGLAVHRISQMRNFKTKIPYPSFIVDLFKNDALPGIFQLGHLLGYQVSVNSYTSTHVKQCFRCQRFGHSSDICSLDFVCLKCSGNHRSNTCSVPREQIKCANCGANHCSNYSQCPKNPKVIKNAKIAAEQEKAIKKDVAAISTQNFNVRPGTNFAAAAANKKPACPPGQSQMPPLNQDHFPKLPPRQRKTPRATPASTTMPAVNGNDLDITIQKLERIRDLLLQIKTLASQVSSTPGLQGLYTSVLAGLA